jgi:hypothetical protein
MDAAGRGHGRGRDIIARAFLLAAEAGQECRPVHLLTALSEVDGPIGDALTPPVGGRLFPRPADPFPARGSRSSYLMMQTQQAARQFAAARAESVEPGHLFLATLDQGEPETMALITDAGLDAAGLRAVALGVVGAEPGFSPIVMPALTPAGTLDRPPLPVEDLDFRVWRVLTWRQDHLPLSRLRRVADWHALSSLEHRAALRLADRAQVDDDQRYSLYAQHHREVERRANAAKPELVHLTLRPRGLPVGRVIAGQGRRWPGWGRTRLNFLFGWPTWFKNRRAGLRDKRFRLLIRSAYRGQPELAAGERQLPRGADN